MAKNFHNGTNIIAKHCTIFLGEEILEFIMASMVKKHLNVLVQKFQPFNLERMMWVIEKFWKHIRIQRPKILQEQTFFLMDQNLC